MLTKMDPAFLLSLLAASSLVFSCIEGAPLVQSKALVIGKDTGSYRGHENPKVTNYINKLIKGSQVKGRGTRGVRRCSIVWINCPIKSKEQQRRDRTENGGSSKKKSG